MNLTWLCIIAGSSIVGAITSLLLQASARKVFLMTLATGLGGIVALVISSFLPDGLLLSWPKVTGAGAVSGITATVFVFVIKRNKVQGDSSVNEATGLALAISSVLFLTVIAFAGPGTISAVSWLALSLVLAVIGIFCVGFSVHKKRMNRTGSDKMQLP